MKLDITFRHMDASDAIKRYARQKVAKLQKFLQQPMTAKVTLSLSKLRHTAEVQISSGGVRSEAKESTGDLYASIDMVMDKLERQIQGAKGAARAKKRRSGATLRGGRNPQPLDQPALPPRASSAPKKKAAKKTSKTAGKKSSAKPASSAKSKRA